MPRDLRGSSIVITGASSGIGAATALECVRAGMNLVLNARREERLREVAERAKALGARTVLVSGDVTTAGLSKRLIDAAEEQLGRVDVVFANAGYGRNKRAVDETDAELREIFEVNFFACAELLRAAARHLMERRRSGHLLMCSSCLSKFALPRHGSYAATKAAQNALCSAMRHEHREHGIAVSSVHPITTLTEFFDVAARVSGTEPPEGGSPAHAPRLFTQPPERVARAVVRCLRRPSPEVWTSHVVRAMAAAGTMFPRFSDWMIARQSAKDGRAR